MYNTWLHWLFKIFVGCLCSTAVYKAALVGAFPFLSTKALVLLCELPGVIFLLVSTIRGPMFFITSDPTSQILCGIGFMFFGMAAKLLVIRFWNAYSAHLLLGPAHEFVDPVRATPHVSFGIVAACILWQCAFSAMNLHSAKSSVDPRAFMRSVTSPFVLFYFFATCYFLYTSAGVLRSLPDKRTRTMSAYMFASALFMVIHIVAIACFSLEVCYRSETAYGLVFFFWYVSRAGTAMCNISIFHAHADSAFLFLEAQNARLAENVRRLEETAGLTALLNAEEIARLLETQRADATKVQLVHQEALVLREKNFVVSALHEVGNPLNGICETLR